MLRKLRSFLAALASFVLAGDAPLGIALARQSACTGWPDGGTKCPQLQATETNLFCGACGCPKWPLADLRTKWRMVDAGCPLEKW